MREQWPFSREDSLQTVGLVTLASVFCEWFASEPITLSESLGTDDDGEEFIAPEEFLFLDDGDSFVD